MQGEVSSCCCRSALLCGSAGPDSRLLGCSAAHVALCQILRDVVHIQLRVQEAEFNAANWWSFAVALLGCLAAHLALCPPQIPQVAVHIHLGMQGAEVNAADWWSFAVALLGGGSPYGPVLPALLCYCWSA